MAENPSLLVEGIDDLNVIKHLLFLHGIKAEEPKKIFDEETIVIKEKGGIKPLLKSIGTETKISETIVGIVVDADVDVKARWQSVADKLAKRGYRNLPAIPNPDGTIIEGDDERPNVGIWLMPDNKLSGMLEDFLQASKERETIWQKAVEVVDSLPEKLFIHEKTDHTRKAQLHTYLAWQEEPGKPFGLAVRATYFQSDTLIAQTFITWVRNLFLL